MHEHNYGLNVWFQNISIPPPQKVFWFELPSPQEFIPHFPSKSLAFETPLPLGISNDLPWGGYGYFLEPHNIQLYRCDYKRVHCTRKMANNDGLQSMPITIVPLTRTGILNKININIKFIMANNFIVIGFFSLLIIILESNCTFKNKIIIDLCFDSGS